MAGRADLRQTTSPTHALLQRMRGLPARSWQNLRSPVALVRNRWRRAKPVPALPNWRVPLAVWAGLILASFFALDDPVGAFRGHWDPASVGAAQALSNMLLGGWYIVPSVLVLLIVNAIDWTRFTGRRLAVLYSWTGIASFGLLSTGLGGLGANILKRALGRARPEHFDDLGPYAFDSFGGSSFAGFPSGHSFTAGAVGAMLVLFFPRLRLVALPATMIAASSRIVLGSHYPSDVIAGYGLGFAATVALAYAFGRLGYLFRLRAGALPAPRDSLRFTWRRTG